MQTANPEIQFRPVTSDDLSMLRHWMEQPHMRAWWGEPDTEIGYIIDMIDGRDTTRPFVFQLDGLDAGYIQYWTVADQRFEPWLSEAPWMVLLPEKAIGVDLSIGDPKLLSKGIGTEVLKRFVAKLRAEGFTEIFIDPAPENKRAVRAYEKAGFQIMPSLIGKTGDSLIMRHEDV